MVKTEQLTDMNERVQLIIKYFWMILLYKWNLNTKPNVTVDMKLNEFLLLTC